MRPLLRRIARDSSGASLIEFALALPIVFYMGGAGIEYTNMARVHLQISQIALDLADNASRVGLSSNLAATQIRETDMNDVLAGARLQGNGLGLTTNGRITISSLEMVMQSYDTVPVQRIHWQRCVGLKSGTGFASSYGTTSTTAGTDATLANAGTTMSTGMGDTGYKVSAPTGAGVMFVEVNYTYQPFFGTMFVTNKVMHYTASFVVRDLRDYAQIYNPSPAATRMTCDRFTS
ncbi:TadE/TadG family type IV pilus assembly protein [Novosphingobium sp. KACC 22771]|uniref:TadE/TadG family type IV pilus assembly protein n=1 Tax=Novosphingobium sp. KACC 22771 TaxID=3025670 RepID=UPI002366A1F6|nr:TadE/TadG family type IV pilus assembly protein [Novosphingobium sp. KACC 22771]WDF72638.1 pilus assembly protein [Novosphingobium sp. KACC 22771]